MKQTLQLKFSQSLTMTPQLQQAIRLLQLSGMELQEEIQQAIESNPMLEAQEDDGSERRTDADRERLGESTTEGRDSDTGLDSDNAAELREPAQDTIPDDLPVDSSWDDTFEPSYGSGSGGIDGERDYEIQGQTSESLQEHLIWQMEVSPFTEKDACIAMSIIDAIDDDGYLGQSVDEILQGLPPELDTEEDEVIAVLHRIQNFDPPGIAARDLRESMLLQLRQLEIPSVWADAAYTIVDQHFDALASRDYAQIMRRLKISEEDLQQVFALIQSLNPRPGSTIASGTVEYIVPDVFVRKKEGKWLVELNPEVMPKLRINDMYAGMIRRSNASSDNVYLKNQLQEARWFIKSLQSRSETLLKVATCIVEHQKAFLERGEEHMKPLVMSDVAEAVEMHESTISRVTTKKYMHTPQGIFELKFFFSSHVSTSSGGECSSTAIRAMIRKLISAEQPNRPLSDSKIASILSEKGINVARRTVAKYREAMSIPPSNERKRLL